MTNPGIRIRAIPANPNDIAVAHDVTIETQGLDGEWTKLLGVTKATVELLPGQPVKAKLEVLVAELDVTGEEEL